MVGVGRHVSRLGGYAPALPTPFGESGDLDVAALQRLCHRQLEDGATALVVCETAGEAPTLSRTEHHTIVSIAAGVAQREIPVIAGAGSNSTRQAIELARDAEVAGADAILSIVPYYNEPTQAGMQAHFARSPSRPACPSSSTTSRRGPCVVSLTRRLCGSPTCRRSLVSRTRPATPRGRCACGH
jgi:4-hydroxy-tetrahydrodipicolinate synthase